jgi:hypothetical protein
MSDTGDALPPLPSGDPGFEPGVGSYAVAQEALGRVVGMVKADRWLRRMNRKTDVLVDHAQERKPR